MKTAELIIKGNVKRYNQFESLFHIDEILNKYLENPNLANMNFLASDGYGYFLRDGRVDLVITRDNLFLKHIYDKESPFKEIKNKEDKVIGYCLLDKDKGISARNADSSLIIEMERIRYSDRNSYESYLEIRTKDGFIKASSGYKKPNREEQKLINRLGLTDKVLEQIGYGKSFLRLFKKKKKKEMTLWILNPSFVKRTLEEEGEGISLWYASYNNTDFNLNLHHTIKPDYLYHMMGQLANFRLVKQDDILEYCMDFVPKACKKRFEKGLKDLYEK